ncbi:MAG TPA: Pycsar system effector family protein [Ignavibacteria bacterium]|jgi:predicted metal-dependent HD superfamily phosphohydrolase
MAQNDIIKKAETYVNKLFNEKLPAGMIYHNYVHALEAVEYARKIAKKSDLNEEDTEIVTLAAWFHDIGYLEVYKGHEDKSIEMAREFLQENRYPEEKIQKVTDCIEATKMPQNPKNLFEQVLCDADLVHLGLEDFFEYSELLRTEWENRGIRNFTDEEWHKTSVELLSSHKFFTPYARKKFEPQQRINLLNAQKKYKKTHERIEEQTGKKAKLEFEKEKLIVEKQKLDLKKNDDKLNVEKEKLEMKKESSKVAERGIETMFRNTVRTHVEFSAMADSKANIMISINTLIIGIIVTGLIRKLVEYPYLTAPTFILMTVCLTCIVFAVFVTRPKITSGMFTREDINMKKTNLLFFGNFFNMPLEDFEWGMNEMMHDKDYLYSSMIRDFYFLGQVLGRKYRNLRICYNIFMYGLIIAVLAYVIAFVMNPQPQPPNLEILQ